MTAGATLSRLRAIVLDWAGTTIDHGSRAPAAVFQEIFRRREVPITVAEARGPMGMAKREHLAAIAAMPAVAERWRLRHGRPCATTEIDAMYAAFLPLQQEVLAQHCEVIRGVPEAIAELRRLGLRIGSSTGYTRPLMDIVAPAAARQGYSPECVLCADDAPRGRPAPYLLYLAAIQLDVYPMSAVVVVDDTPVGIEAGRNAGCWTVGVTRTGNGLGLSEAEVAGLSDEERRQRCAAAERTLRAAGAHAIVESVAEIVPVVHELDRLAAAR